MDTKRNTWGQPGSKSTEEQWINYSDQILKINSTDEIDLIMIDGRFRVACCLKCFDKINENAYIMFDDFLDALSHDRESFTNLLYKEHSYSFIIVHHKNKYLIDYADEFGINYCKLVIVIERETETNRQYINVDTLDALINNPQYSSLEECKLKSKHPECIICKRYDNDRDTVQLIKIQSPEYNKKCERLPKYANIWHSYICIFIKNDPTFTIDMFRTENNITDVYNANNMDINITGMITLLYKHTATIIMDLVNHFTDFDYINHTFDKINIENYNLLTDKKYNIIKKIVASIQTLVNKGIIKTNNHIIQNLRKYYCPKKFLILLSSIKLLNENTDFCKIKNKYYENYLNFLSEQINL